MENPTKRTCKGFRRLGRVIRQAPKVAEVYVIFSPESHYIVVIYDYIDRDGLIDGHFMKFH